MNGYSFINFRLSLRAEELNMTEPTPYDKDNASTPVVFSEADHETWRTFYAMHQRILKEHKNLIHPYYAENMNILQLFKSGIPSLQTINKILMPLGWSARYVHGYHPPWKIFQLIHQRIMPLSSSIRPANEVGFASEPDLIHDIFGHLPALLHGDYRKLLSSWAAIAQSQPVSPADQALYYVNKTIVEHRATNEELVNLKGLARQLGSLDHCRLSPVQILDKLYFWGFEFSVIKSANGLQVLGAGLLSSLTELETIETRFQVAREQHQEIFKPLNFETLTLSYNISDAQDGYFYGESIADYQDLIKQTAAWLAPAPANFTPQTERLRSYNSHHPHHQDMVHDRL